MVTTVKAVIFDYGEVLSLPQSPSALEELQKISGLTNHRFSKIYWKYRPEYDLGLTDGKGYWEKVLNTAGVTPAQDQIQKLIKADVLSWSELDPTMWSWVLNLRTHGFQTALISNMVPELGR